jgi:monofunctional biosynthetic peptidoglycan transglycosylase
MSSHPIRRFFRIARWGAPLLLLALTCLAVWRYLSLPDVAVLKDRRATLTIPVRDWQGREHPFLLGPKNRDWVSLGSLPEAMKWAVIVAEDANFYEHQGVDLQAMKDALKYDLEQKRLARGASTITQQLAKNVFLSRQKSLLRKAEEIILAQRIERELSKGRILELYLNVVELGPLVHGVGEGARYHFHKPAAALTPAECAFLAAILPGPRVAYNPKLKAEKVRHRAVRILRLLAGRGILSDAEHATALALLAGRSAIPVPSLAPAPELEPEPVLEAVELEKEVPEPEPELEPQAEPELAPAKDEAPLSEEEQTRKS